MEKNYNNKHKNSKKKVKNWDKREIKGKKEEKKKK